MRLVPGRGGGGGTPGVAGARTADVAKPEGAVLQQRVCHGQKLTVHRGFLVSDTPITNCYRSNVAGAGALGILPVFDHFGCQCPGVNAR